MNYTSDWQFKDFSHFTIPGLEGPLKFTMMCMENEVRRSVIKDRLNKNILKHFREISVDPHLFEE